MEESAGQSETRMIGHHVRDVDVPTYVKTRHDAIARATLTATGDTDVTDPLKATWFAKPDDNIGGWCVMTVDATPMEAERIPEANFLSEAVAKHIADLHNARLSRQQPAIPRTSGGIPSREILRSILVAVVSDSYYRPSVIAHDSGITLETLTEIEAGDRYRILTPELFDLIMKACGCELLATWRALPDS